MKKIVLTAAVLLSTAAQADGEKIAVFTKNLSNPYFQVVRLGTESAAKQMNAMVQHYVPTKPDSIPEQMSQIEDVIVKKPNAIVFIPVDYKAMAVGVSKINAANIPVTNVTDRSESGKFVAYVGADDYSLGLETGRFMLKAMGGKGNVVILEGVKASLTNIDRVRGFKKAIEETPGVKLLAAQTGNYQRLQALQVMENLMQTFPQIDGVLAANDAMAVGVIEAMEAANRKALVVGINGTKEAIDAIKAGKLLASGDYAGFQQGCLGAMVAIRDLRKLSVPKEVVFPASVIHKGNYQPYDVVAEQRSCPKYEDLIK